ncbi:MAG TPA: allophanate hydrolase subunit 1 [Urbifossiella sp.]|nr:allophanate hydrolase subunit 1 [Urbifossiella sp.]
MTPRFVPLGDQAVLGYFADEAAAARFAQSVRAAAPLWLQDVAPAYASAGIFFDADAIKLDDVIAWLQQLDLRSLTLPARQAVGSRFTIPVCYERQLDLHRVAECTGVTPDRVIELHAATEYTVYAIGFVPGFPYLGYLPEELCGVPRLESPRLKVEPGSVGLTGRQTGIYPLPRPGGWNIIGRTPLTIVDMADGFFPLRVGDRVRFERIDEARYRELDGERLAPD